MARLPLDRPANFINRELSWLAFNQRVLEEALDASNPLLERVKFLAITASNLDEFIEIRVGGLLQQIEEGFAEPSPDGLTPIQARDRIAAALHTFTTAQYRCWNERLRPALMLEGICTLALEELRPAERRFIADYCKRELEPLLTPVTVDPAHPFPHVVNKALCLALLLRRGGGKGARALGIITLPRNLPRLIRLPGTAENFVYLGHVAAAHAVRMYRGFRVESAAAFRVTRNSNLYLREEESRDLLETVRIELHNRRKGTAVRLEIERGADPLIIERLRSNFELEPWQVVSTPGPVNLARVLSLYDQAPRRDLKFTPYVPPPQPAEPFAALRAADRLWHHPFDSYSGVVAFLQSAVNDPNVLSIKQTLYRTTQDSKVLQALMRAAQTKEVAVVVELKARFDEAVNIAWARRLEDAGVQVFYGGLGRKTHAKMALLVRQDEDGVLRRYLHLGTGNYNERTARQYTDFSLLTARPELAAAAHAVFGYLTADTEPDSHAPLLVAPLDLFERFRALIAREVAHARRGRPARIVAKMNALSDSNLIQALYAASQAGVDIDLIVRGICCLRPGVPGLSENIRVRSIVGRYLEHSRIFYFRNGGDEEVYLGSADWMPRNLYERVEVVFPILDPRQRRWLRQHVLAAYLADTAKARFLMPDGRYRRPRQRRFQAQEFLALAALGRASTEQIPAEDQA